MDEWIDGLEKRKKRKRGRVICLNVSVIFGVKLMNQQLAAPLRQNDEGKKKCLTLLAYFILFHDMIVDVGTS